MAPVKGNATWQSALARLTGLAILAALAVPALRAQSAGQNPSNPPASSQPAQDIPDAPSTVQPPPKPVLPAVPVGPARANEPIPFPGDEQKKPDSTSQQDQDKTATPAMPPIQTLPAGTTPRNQLSPQDDLYKLVVKVNFVQLPVMVKNSDGRRVDGLLAKDFTVKENGKPQTLTYFTSDPFELSVAIVLDIGMSDVSLQKVNQTYSALVGAFSPYDEVALYTYSSTVSQVTDFTGRPERIIAALNEMKLVRGRNNGPAVLGGPLGPQGPTVNGIPLGGGPAPVSTPPREAHVLNDAILRAALDLSKRDRTRRKVIFVISDGRELGSKASYSGVLHLLQSRDIQVRAVVVDSGALPGFKQIEKFHVPDQGRTNNLTRFVRATCGEDPYAELSRNSIEDAYMQIANEARNQYTLGYSPQAVTGTSAYRTIEVVVHKRDLKVSAKDGYFAVPTAH
jgi:VWFA-related protein